MKPLQIAVLAHIRHPIAMPFMGGMESHAWHLTRGLTQRGHEVTLFASGDSDAGVGLHPVLQEHYDKTMNWNEFHGTKAMNTMQDDAFAKAMAALSQGNFDIIHNNSLHRYPPRMARRDRLPMVTSLHVPPFDALHRAVLASPAPWSHFTVCSQRQEQVWWPHDAPVEAHVVPNGIDISAWPFNPQGDGSGVWAGRITPTKGLHIAIQAARIAGTDLTIIGVIEDQDYFDAQVKPFLNANIRYAGHLGAADLARAMGRASYCLFTPLWDEPFGLVAIEAMACGLPVAATDMGAVQEVVGNCGRLAPADDPAALARAIEAAVKIPRYRPRERVEKFFKIDRMLDSYEAIYRAAIAGRHRDAPGVDFPPIELPPQGDMLSMV